MVTEEHLAQLNSIIDRALANQDLLNNFQIKFITEWVDRLEVQGDRVRVSDKQQWVFDEILKRLETNNV